MHSVKLTIEGTYWDSQIYSGELMLFDYDGGVHRIDWRNVIDSIAEKNPLIQTAIRVAFADSDLFYNPKVRKILCDPQIEIPIKLQLQNLATIDTHATSTDWKEHWRTEETPFNFLPTDIDIYYNQIFAGGDEGLFSTPRSGLSGNRFSGKKTTKHHDARIFQVRASDRHTAVAAAAGNDGLFEFAFNRSESDVLEKHTLLSPRDCNACEWAFQSVMGWTSTNAFLASFKQEKVPQTRQVIRSFDRIVEASEMFGEDGNGGNALGFTWGSREKVYRISASGIEVANYKPEDLKTKKKNAVIQQLPLFTKIGSLKLDFNATNVIATGTAPFGTVLEFEDRIVVMRSDSQVDEFPGEPVHWRIFPRSELYSNQLHIVYEDHLLVVSFVHDYFVDQGSKLSGFTRGKNGPLSDSED